MKKITIIACIIIMTSSLKAQEIALFIHLKNGNAIEIPVSEIDSITFKLYQPNETVTFTISYAINVTPTSATFNVSVTTVATVIEKGICYSSQNSTPTTNDLKVSEGAGSGNFSVTLTNLTENTQYYTRPYAIVYGAIYYGPVKTFNTLQDGVVINGLKWATRNLAAHGQFVENPEDYGALFQWGRSGDGHEQRTSPKYPTNNTSVENGVVSGSQNFDANGQIVNTHTAYGKFIKQDESPRDWRTPQDNALWNSGSESIPVKTANDPCPEGWRLPTQAEFLTLGNGEWTNSPTSGRCFGSGTNTLFLPAAGARSAIDGGPVATGMYGWYRSSSIKSSNAYAYDLYFSSTGVNPNNDNPRASGLSVRCVAEY